MKNQFSKALICGVVASSVFLVNCQKSPTRGVSPTKSGTVSGKGTAADADIAQQAKVACVPEIIDAQKAYLDIANKIDAIVADKSDPKNITVKEKSKVAASDKEDLKKYSTDLKVKSDAVLAAFKKANVKACLFDEAKEKAVANSGVVTSDQITASYNSLANAINSITGEVTVKLKEAPAVVAAKEDLNGSNFNLDSKELGESFGQVTKDSGIYYIDGALEKNIQIVRATNGDDTKSLCAITSAADGGVEKDSLITVSNVTEDAAVGKKKSYSVAATATGSKAFMIKCVIAVNKSLVSEFKSVFKGLLRFQSADEVAPAKTTDSSVTTAAVSSTPVADSSAATTAATTTTVVSTPAPETPIAATETKSEAAAPVAAASESKTTKPEIDEDAKGLQEAAKVTGAAKAAADEAYKINKKNFDLKTKNPTAENIAQFQKSNAISLASNTALNAANEVFLAIKSNVDAKTDDEKDKTVEKIQAAADKLSAAESALKKLK